MAENAAATPLPAQPAEIAPYPNWLTRDEVAQRLRLTRGPVADWAHEGEGPPFIKVGKHVRYRLSDLEAFENERFRT